MEESGLGRKLSCSLQDSGPAAPAAKPRQRNALGRELSCSLQDSAGGAAGLAGAVLAGFAARTQGESAGTAGDRRDDRSAISADYLDRPGDTRHRCEACGGVTPASAAPGNQVDCRQAGGDDNWKAGRIAGSSGSGDRSSGGSRSGCVPSIVNASLRAICNTPAKTKTRIWIRSKLAPWRGS